MRCGDAGPWTLAAGVDVGSEGSTTGFLSPAGQGVASRPRRNLGGQGVVEGGDLGQGLEACRGQEGPWLGQVRWAQSRPGPQNIRLASAVSSPWAVADRRLWAPLTLHRSVEQQVRFFLPT